MEDALSTVDGLLIDIDGVLTVGNEVIPGAPDTIRELRARDIAFRFMTNTTIYCRRSLFERMSALGFDIREGELFTATYAAATYLRSQEAASYYPLLLPDAQLEFSGIPIDAGESRVRRRRRHGGQSDVPAHESGLSRIAQRRAACGAA